MKFDVHVARRTAGFSDLADATQMNTLPSFDAGRDVNVKCCAGPNASVPRARWAGRRDDGSVSSTRTARGGRDNVAQQTADLTLNRATTATHVAARRVRTRNAKSPNYVW